jgi:transposase
MPVPDETFSESPQTTPTKTSKNEEWTTPRRVRVKTMLECGVSKHEISRQLKIDRKTIRRIEQQETSRRPGKLRSGRPASNSERDLRHLIFILRKNWEGRKLNWAKLGRDAGLSVSGWTIKRALNSVGYTRCKACKKPFISKDAQEKRYNYAQEHIDKPREY